MLRSSPRAPLRVFLSAALGLARTGPSLGGRSPGFIAVGPGIDGRTYPVPAKTKATALVFIAHDCPICNRYAPELRRISDDYSRRGLTLYVVYTEPDLKPKDAQMHLREFGLPAPALRDPTHRLVKAFDAHITPEAVVLDEAGRLTYQGRIDDRFIAYGMERPKATTHDLRVAIDRTLNHTMVATKGPNPVGCYITP